MEQRCHGTLQVWAEPFTRLRLPKIYNLRTDPYEFADVTSNTYYEWFIYHAYIIYGAQAIAGQFAATFKDFPPIQKPNSFTIDDAIKAMEAAQPAAQSAGWRVRSRGGRLHRAAVAPSTGGRPWHDDPLPSWNDGPAKRRSWTSSRA